MVGRSIGKQFTKGEGKKLLEDAAEIISGKRGSKIIKQRNELFKKKVKDAQDKAKIDDQVKEVSDQTDTIIKVDKKVKQPKVSDQQADDILKSKSSLTPKQLSDFNINKLDSREDILKFIEGISKTLKNDINFRKRGKQTNETTQELAQILQMNPKKLTANLLGIKRGQTANAETILAAREVYVAAVNKLDDLALKAESGGKDALMEFRQHLALTSELQKIIKGLQTETARALQQFKITPRDQKFKNVNLENLNRDKIILEVGGEEEIRDIATFYLRSGKGKAQLIEKTGTATKISQALSEIFINGILANPYTHVRNTAGNAIVQGIYQIEKKAGQFISRKFGDGAVSGIAEYEDIAKNFGRTQAFTEMWGAMAKGLREGKGITPIKNQLAGNKVEVRTGAATAANFDMKAGKAADFFDFAGKVLTLNRIPTKFLTQADAFFKNMEYRSELYAEAYRDTLKKVRTGVIKREDAPDYLADLVTNPDQSMTKKAFDAALKSTFQNPLKERQDFLKFGENIQRIKSGSGAFNVIGNYYLPFIQTPTNVAGFVIERTPIFQFALKGFRDDFMAGGVRRQEALAKIMLGHAAFLTIAGMNLNGYVRGTNPSLAKDFQLKGSKLAMEKTLGLQDGTFIVGDTQVALQDVAFDPLAMFVKMSADMTELARMGFNDQNELQDYMQILTGLFYSFGDNIGSSTFMSGIGKLVDDYRSFEQLGFVEGGKRTLKKAIPSFIPGSSIVGAFDRNRAFFAGDDYRKIAVDFEEFFLKKAYSKNLNPEYDLLGDKIEAYGTVTKLKKDPLRDELAKLNPQINPIERGRQIDLLGGVPVTVEYTSAEMSFMQQRAGTYFKQQLNEYFTSDDYTDPEIENWQKREAVADIYRGATAQAYADLRGEGDDELPAYRDFEGVKLRMDTKASEKTISKIKQKQAGVPLSPVGEAEIKQQMDEIINDN